MKSAPSTTCAPSLRSSAAIAAMRSVSLTRQLAMFVSRLGPSAYSAITASVMAASGMWLQSRVSARSGHAPRRTSSQFGPLSTCAPMARAASTKRMSPCTEALPTPSMRTCRPSWAAIAPRATKYDAEEASPSTWTSPGVRYAEPEGIVKRSKPSRCTAMPKRSSMFSVISM